MRVTNSELHLVVPARLADEFKTVSAVLSSGGETAALDAFILSWTKHEKHLRRLFCFLVYRLPSGSNWVAYEKALSRHRGIYTEHFRGGIEKLAERTLDDLIGERFDELDAGVANAKAVRQKVIHGQPTGLAIGRRELMAHVRSLVGWIEAAADAAEHQLGYDGIARGAHEHAQRCRMAPRGDVPFVDLDGFKQWLDGLVSAARGSKK